MTYTIRKRFTFSASHQLTGLPAGHQCARLHGHNYVVVLELSSHTLDATGFVRDFGELEPFKRFLADTLDHRHLNDVLEVQPTAENLARYLYDIAATWWDNVTAVSVAETDTTIAEYTP